MRSKEFTSSKKVHIGKIIFYVISGIVALLLSIVLVVTLTVSTSGDAPNIFGHNFYCVTGNGYAQKGDFVISKPMQPQSLKGDQVIVIKDGVDGLNKAIIKTVKVTSLTVTDGVTSFSASNDKNAESFSEDVVLGEVLWSIPNIGTVVLYLKTAEGLINCIAIPLFILLVLEIIKLSFIAKAEKKQKQEAENKEELPSYMRMGLDKNDTDIFGLEPPDSLTLPNQTNSPMDEGASDVYSMPSQASATLFGGASDTSCAPSKLNTQHITEAQDEPLEMVAPEGQIDPLNYVKPELIQAQATVSSLYSTREFTLEEEVAETTEQTGFKDFSASMSADKTNEFDIEGMAVKVQPEALRIAFEDDAKYRDISITVTQEYTNLVVDTGEYEVNFALFKDDVDKTPKVIIQKKKKENQQ